MTATIWTYALVRVGANLLVIKPKEGESALEAAARYEHPLVGVFHCPSATGVGTYVYSVTETVIEDISKRAKV